MEAIKKPIFLSLFISHIVNMIIDFILGLVCCVAPAARPRNQSPVFLNLFTHFEPIFYWFLICNQHF
jgi:hypothetical protein